MSRQHKPFRAENAQKASDRNENVHANGELPSCAEKRSKKESPPTISAAAHDRFPAEPFPQNPFRDTGIDAEKCRWVPLVPPR